MVSRHDLSRASDLALFAAVRAALGAPFQFGMCVPHCATTRRALEAFAAVLVDEPNEDFQELAALRAECRLKTLAEYDREIGDLLRRSVVGSGRRVVLRTEDCTHLSQLLDASRTASEGEP